MVKPPISPTHSSNTDRRQDEAIGRLQQSVELLVGKVSQLARQMASGPVEGIPALREEVASLIAQMKEQSGIDTDQDKSIGQLSARIADLMGSVTATQAAQDRMLRELRNDFSSLGGVLSGLTGLANLDVVLNNGLHAVAEAINVQLQPLRDLTPTRQRLTGPNETALSVVIDSVKVLETWAPVSTLPVPQGNVPIIGQAADPPTAPPAWAIGHLTRSIAK